MGETLFGKYSYGHNLQMGGKNQANDFFEMLLLIFHVNLDDEHHLTTKTMGKGNLHLDACPWKDT